MTTPFDSAQGKPWYRINAEANYGPAELEIFGDIGESWFAEESITAKSISKDLKPLSGRDLTVRINSYGGSVADGLAIYNALRRHAQTAKVVTAVEGVAMSIASLIAMAGDTREMAGNALYMVHAPWGVSVGNSKDMRQTADILDKYADAMTSAYTRSALTPDEIKALLTDGEDHFYNAEEAEAAGFVTAIRQDLPIAASYIKNRFTQAAAPGQPIQASAPISPPKESPMTTENQPKGAETPAPVNVASIEAAAQAKALEAIKARAGEIRAMFKPFMSREGLAALQDECLDDPSMPLDTVSAKLLTKLGEGAEPIASNPRIESGEDASDKFKKGVTASLQHRMGLGQDDRANEFRGKSLTDIAALSLEIRGQSTKGMTKSEIAGKVLAAHSTSDFPLLLADSANKQLQAAYGAFPAIWDRLASVGSVTDFKTISILKLGSFSSLATKLEGAEYTAGTMSEEREQLTASTKGRYIQCTREMLINDDLSAFSRMAAMLGRAAARTVNADVLGVITANGATADGFNLFSTDHANLTGSGTAISIASLSLARKMMRVQKDPSGLDYLNIQPRFLLAPVGKEDLAREVITSAYNTDSTGALKRNVIQDWGTLEVLSDPLLDANSTTAWYLISDPMDAPLLEVRFLDGQQSPFIDSEEEFLTDAIRWKVRLDYGVASNEWRGGYKNVGA
jgi:ATP-dependent protease ClpP protease subunit